MAKRPNKSSARKSAEKIRRAKKAAILKSIAAGATVETAAGAAGISRVTFYQWRKDDPKFNEAAESKHLAVIRSVEGALVRAATVPDEKGKVNVTAQIFYLANRAPDRWRSVNRHELTGAGGGPVTLAHLIEAAEKDNGEEGKPE